MIPLDDNLQKYIIGGNGTVNCTVDTFNDIKKNIENNSAWSNRRLPMTEPKQNIPSDNYYQMPMYT